ncbi:hypothetical protein [Paenibacillus xylanexedens]|uniref:hypothetical protein n=1 Tax=Paenibacillus xylanexedens TaxID=528191 RepID=UPI0011AA3AE6|nr:hypothetical protein [Paenibacillus xylanexedens]
MKNSGFYKLKFLVTPEEMRSMLELFQQKECRFTLSNYAATTHDLDQVCEAYETYFQYFTAQEKPNYHPHWVYSVACNLDQRSSGLFMKNEGHSFPVQDQWAEDEFPYILLSLPKGFQVNLQDERGNYYIYEVIREHLPLTYALFEEASQSIKKMTKPLRFKVCAGVSSDALQEQKPPVRISPSAAQEISTSWLFEKYRISMSVK